MKKAIIIMTKVPFAGNVKTRMQPFLSEMQSEELATALLKDAEQKVINTPYASIIAYSPANLLKPLKAILQHYHLLIDQAGKDLGDRMMNAFRFGFSKDFDAIVMIGTDSPTFPAESIDEAFEQLENDRDLVLGESKDGGFYLIGLRRSYSDLFEGVNWESNDTFRYTLRNAERLGMCGGLVVPWYDVDLPADLERLKDELTKKPDLAPHTSEWLKKI